MMTVNPGENAVWLGGLRVTKIVRRPFGGYVWLRPDNEEMRGEITWTIGSDDQICRFHIGMRVLMCTNEPIWEDA